MDFLGSSVPVRSKTSYASPSVLPSSPKKYSTKLAS